MYTHAAMLDSAGWVCLQGAAGWAIDPRDQASVLQCLLPFDGQLKRAAAGQGVAALISCPSFQTVRRNTAPSAWQVHV